MATNSGTLVTACFSSNATGSRRRGDRENVVPQSNGQEGGQDQGVQVTAMVGDQDKRRLGRQMISPAYLQPVGQPQITPDQRPPEQLQGAVEQEVFALDTAQALVIGQRQISGRF